MGAQDGYGRCCGKPDECCVFMTSFLARHAEPCSMCRDAHQLPCLYRFPRPTTWFGCISSVAVGCWCWAKGEGGGKVDSTFIMAAMRLEGCQSLDGRAWNARASGCGPRQHALESDHDSSPLTVSVGATVINQRRPPMASERSGRSGIGRRLSGQGQWLGQKAKPPIKIISSCDVSTPCTTRVPLSCLTDQAAKSNRSISKSV
ncbi:hypothetical protein B0T18DRAFT_205298 [Schizothecium vesticola]|uniref:Uncharacterized protein n=1 Tax=Schizothecium vesticola TaxID=314040 RepID=A0AA40EJ30_9PEZI|nr:hypothetical protein B0T18DRAFT_205298 [Schizothecium vesticola]